MSANNHRTDGIIWCYSSSWPISSCDLNDKQLKIVSQVKMNDELVRALCQLVADEADKAQ